MLDSSTFGGDTAPKQRPQLLTRKEAAAYLGITEGTLAVWNCTKRYPIPYIKIGRLARYRIADLDAFIESRVKI
jgi:excisionase family DNA binding protein